jgi:hypothetical protein
MRHLGTSIVLVISCALITQANAANLLGINSDDGRVYNISTVDAAMSLAGNTGIPSAAALEFAPNGKLYMFTTSGAPTPTLYELNPTTFAPTPIGPLNTDFVFEGGLAFSPDGLNAYATNGTNSGTPKLLKLNLGTGAASVVGTISGGAHDINGLAWRSSDNMLVGLDREGNRLVAINPTTAVSSLIATVTPTIGGVGGMTVLNGVGYFNTAAATASPAGSNELWQFNLATGAHTRIGSLAPTISSGNGISGLAAIPEPGSLAVLLLVGVTALRRRAGQFA